jgi:hypothetical protein
MAKLRDISEIRIGARVYPITWDADEVETLRECLAEDDEDGGIPASASGMIDHNTRTICLDPTCLATPLTAFEILLHEAFHAVECFAGLDLDEAKIEALAAGFASVLIQSGFLTPEEYSVCGIPLAAHRKKPEPAEDQ